MIAIIGGNGQLGQELSRILSDGQAASLGRADIDLADSDSIARAIKRVAPDIVINTAAFNHVDDAEQRSADAFQVNALGVRELARVCQELGAVFVHYSTDYAFGLDSFRDHSYDELALPGPVNVYGASKLAGEHLVRAVCSKHFVIRTCGLYGRHGHGGKGRNFVQTMLRLGRERGQVRVVGDQRCTPTAAADLAQATLKLIRTDAYGLYHYTNSGSCTWYEFAREIFSIAKMNVKCEPITTAQFGARAIRPTYSVLSHEKFDRLGLGPVRAWQDALRDFVSDLGG